MRRQHLVAQLDVELNQVDSMPLEARFFPDVLCSNCAISTSWKSTLNRFEAVQRLLALCWAQFSPPWGSRRLCFCQPGWTNGSRASGSTLRGKSILCVARSYVVVVNLTSRLGYRCVPARWQLFSWPMPLAVTRGRVVVERLPTTTGVSSPSIW